MPVSEVQLKGGWYRYLAAREPKKGNGIGDLSELFPPCPNGSIKAGLVSKVKPKMSVATYPASTNMELKSGVWSQWALMMGIGVLLYSV